MITTTGLKTLLLSSLIAGLLCFGYWKYRGVDRRYEDLLRNQQDIEKVRQEVQDLETRLEQTRARVKALENDPVEEEAAARRIGRTVRSKSETVFHLDESRMTPAPPPESAPKPADTGTPAAPTEPAPKPVDTATPAPPIPTVSVQPPQVQVPPPVKP